MRRAGVLLALALSLAFSARDSLLGTGHGVDHVGIAVRDLSTAAEAFRALGFNVRPGGRHPTGTENAVVRFKDRTYLELITDYDAAKAPDIARFVERHEGALFLGMAVSSAQSTAATMRRRGFEPDGPEAGTIVRPGETNPPPRWYGVGFKKPLFADDNLFFIEYVNRAGSTSGNDASNTDHVNTATRLRAAWLAVRNLKAATRALERLGLHGGRRSRLASLGAEGQEIVAGSGMILLLQPIDATGSVAQFVAERGEAMIGVTIEVRDLAHAPNSSAPFRGLFGASVLIPPSAARGAWIELAPEESAHAHR